MNFINNWFRNNIFSDNREDTFVHVSGADVNEEFADQTSDSNQNEGVLSFLAEGLNNIVDTFRTSVSDIGGRRSSLFVDSTTKTSGTSERLQQSGHTSATSASDGFCRGSVDPRRRADSCGARPCRPHGCDQLKNENYGEKGTNLKRATATNNLSSIEATVGNKPTAASNNDRSVSAKKRGPTCAIEVSSLHEDDDNKADLADPKQDRLSFMDIVRNNLNSLQMNIVLRHRRYNRRGKRQRLADYYRKKYNSKAMDSPKGKDSEEEVTESGKSKGVSRFINFVRGKFTGQRRSRTDSVRRRVAVKMEQRKQLYKGQSRVEIVAHIRGKYSKNN